jgi:hypothetical protein
MFTTKRSDDSSLDPKPVCNMRCYKKVLLEKLLITLKYLIITLHLFSDHLLFKDYKFGIFLSYAR